MDFTSCSFIPNGWLNWSHQIVSLLCLRVEFSFSACVFFFFYTLTQFTLTILKLFSHLYIYSIHYTQSKKLPMAFCFILAHMIALCTAKSFVFPVFFYFIALVVVVVVVIVAKFRFMDWIYQATWNTAKLNMKINVFPSFIFRFSLVIRLQVGFTLHHHHRNSKPWLI